MSDNKHPDWLKAEIEAQDDPKVVVSLKWLRLVLEKAGMEMPEGLEATAR